MKRGRSSAQSAYLNNKTFEKEEEKETRNQLSICSARENQLRRPSFSFLNYVMKTSFVPLSSSLFIFLVIFQCVEGNFDEVRADNDDVSQSSPEFRAGVRFWGGQPLL